MGAVTTYHATPIRGPGYAAGAWAVYDDDGDIVVLANLGDEAENERITRAVVADLESTPPPGPALEQEIARAIAEARLRWGPQAMAWVFAPATDPPLPRRCLVCPRPGLARGADTFAEAFERAEQAFAEAELRTDRRAGTEGAEIV